MTQLSNFFAGGYAGFADGAYGIGLDVVTSRVIEALIALLSRLSALCLVFAFAAVVWCGFYLYS